MGAALIDAECVKCKAHIGWVGTMANKPACRKCGHREPQAELDAAEKRMREYLDRIHAQRDAKDAAKWNARTAEQEALYAEGQEAADKAGTRGKMKILPLDVPSPYVATETTDGKFWREHHHWWMWGWSDAERNIDRRGAKHGEAAIKGADSCAPPSAVCSLHREPVTPSPGSEQPGAGHPNLGDVRTASGEEPAAGGDA